MDFFDLPKQGLVLGVEDWFALVFLTWICFQLTRILEQKESVKSESSGAELLSGQASRCIGGETEDGPQNSCPPPPGSVQPRLPTLCLN